MDSQVNICRLVENSSVGAVIGIAKLRRIGKGKHCKTREFSVLITVCSNQNVSESVKLFRTYQFEADKLTISPWSISLIHSYSKFIGS